VRVLLLHVDHISYRTVKPALKRPPDPPGEYEAGEAVVAYVTVEAGDDDRVVGAAASDIVSYARETVHAPRIVLYPYAHLSNRLEKPARAHRLLARLEALVRESFAGEVHRAPFGWYKAFRVEAKGHPLAELSRHYDPETLTLYTLEDGARIPLQEAEKQGHTPPCLARPPKPRGVAAEKAGLLGLDKPGTWQHRAVAESLARRLAGPTYTLHGHAGDPLAAYKLVAEAGTGAVAGTPQGTVAYASWEDAAEVLEDASPGLAGSLTRVPLCGAPPCLDAGLEGELLVYQSPDGWCAPIGARGPWGAALGPSTSLLLAAIDHEARRAAGEDTVPRLPAWLHPITAYIIPVPGAEEYAATIAGELAWAGARVVLDESTRSIGPRIRTAGRMWAPLTVTIGPREAETGTVTVRRRWRPGEQETLPAARLLDEVRGLLFPAGPPGLVERLPRG